MNGWLISSWHEVTSVLFCDWMEINVMIGKKRERHLSTSPRRAEARCIRPSSSEPGGGGGICIQVVGPWENVSLECIVSHIGSHLENDLPTSPRLLLSVPSTCSSRSPSYVCAHARGKHLHSQTSFIRVCKICQKKRKTFFGRFLYE